MAASGSGILCQEVVAPLPAPPDAHPGGQLGPLARDRRRRRLRDNGLLQLEGAQDDSDTSSLPFTPVQDASTSSRGVTANFDPHRLPGLQPDEPFQHFRIRR